jgi:hypothetical protein
VARIPLYHQRVMSVALHGGKITPDRDFHFDAYNRWIAGRGEALAGPCRPGLSSDRRLAAFYMDDEWRREVAAAFRELLFGSRELIARWAPLLANSGAGVQVLNQLAEEVERINWLHKTLAAPRQGDCPSELIEMWASEFANAVHLNEYLVGVARQHMHRSSSRDELTRFEGRLDTHSEAPVGRPFVGPSITGECPVW